VNLGATTELSEATRRIWDVLVVGAGPAGALAAYELARWGFAVLLVDQASFPRWKVCGCCLNGQALATLHAAELGHLARSLGAIPLRQLVLAGRGRRALVRLRGGVALSREAFDTALIESAMTHGATFLAHTRATLCGLDPSARKIALHQADRPVETLARVVVAASGLGGCRTWSAERGTRSTEGSSLRDSWIGAGVVVPASPPAYCPRTIFMACGTRGYVGLVRLEDGRLDVAAAFHPTLVKRGRHLGEVAAAIIAEAGLPSVPDLGDLPWRGTPPLTRRAKNVATERLFVIGDAAGYVQPFTGEGIAWALAAARAVAPLAVRAAVRWEPGLAEQWTRCYDCTVTSQQGPCRALMNMVQHPLLTATVIAILSRLPALARPVLRRLHQSSPTLRGSSS
jgi:flavin-dependent dehydrogenase